MFTGIIEEVGTLNLASQNNLKINAKQVLADLEIGGSIAVNGVCLTVTHFDEFSFTAGIMPETLNRTNLGILKNGDKVNLERPLYPTKPIGGHFVQGHVDGTGRIRRIAHGTSATVIAVSASSEIMRYIVEKGFICIDGISLTITEVNNDEFKVSIVPHSLANTTLSDFNVPRVVNLEVDVIAKYVEKFLRPNKNKISAEFLSEHGFSAG